MNERFNAHSAFIAVRHGSRFIPRYGLASFAPHSGPMLVDVLSLDVQVSNVGLGPFGALDSLPSFCICGLAIALISYPLLPGVGSYGAPFTSFSCIRSHLSSSGLRLNDLTFNAPSGVKTTNSLDSSLTHANTPQLSHLDSSLSRWMLLGFR